MDLDQMARKADVHNTEPDRPVDVTPAIGASQSANADTARTIGEAHTDQITDTDLPADADIDTQRQLGTGLNSPPIDNQLDLSSTQTGALGGGNLETIARPFDDNEKNDRNL